MEKTKDQTVVGFRMHPENYGRGPEGLQRPEDKTSEGVGDGLMGMQGTYLAVRSRQEVSPGGYSKSGEGREVVQTKVVPSERGGKKWRKAKLSSLKEKEG